MVTKPVFLKTSYRLAGTDLPLNQPSCRSLMNSKPRLLILEGLGPLGYRKLTR